MALNLHKKKCKPCEGNVLPLSLPKAEEYLKEVKGWKLASNGRSITKTLRFKDFKSVMAFVNKVADLAEEEGHHPDLHVFYDELGIEISTHAIDGLSENDFILAAKIDLLVR